MATRSNVISSFTIIKGSLIEETYSAFAAWDDKRSKKANRDRMKAQNTIRTRSETWLRDVAKVLNRRFDPDGRDRALVSLAKAHTIAVSGPRVLAGTSNGFIYPNDDARAAAAATAWPGVQPREGFVSSITRHPGNADVVYATYAGFGGQHVWKSTDGGVSWAPLDGEGDGQIPDIPVHSLVVDPQRPERLFIGSDLGVMVSIDGGAHWMTEADGLPNVVTEWLVIASGPEGRSLYAFTHGRGVWRAILPGETTARRRSVRH